MNVTIVSCLYGTGYERFITGWAQSIEGLNTQPDEVIVGVDRTAFERGQHIPRALAVRNHCDWRHPQAFHLQKAIERAETEWVWILDMDDFALPDALDGLEDIDADVMVVGYQRSDGVTYIPPQLTAVEYLLGGSNPFPAGSIIRRESFLKVGGFPDVAFQDYGLWRRMATAWMRFQASHRAHYVYRLHEHSRTSTELLPDRRRAHLRELQNSEAAHVG